MTKFVTINRFQATPALPYMCWCRVSHFSSWYKVFFFFLYSKSLQVSAYFGYRNILSIISYFVRHTLADKRMTAISQALIQQTIKGQSVTGRWAAQSRLVLWLMSEVSPALANVTSEWVNHSWMMCHCIRRILEGAYVNALRE